MKKKYIYKKSTHDFYLVFNNHCQSCANNCDSYNGVIILTSIFINISILRSSILIRKNYLYILKITIAITLILYDSLCCVRKSLRIKKKKLNKI